MVVLLRTWNRSVAHLLDRPVVLLDLPMPAMLLGERLAANAFGLAATWGDACVMAQLVF